ncbi:MAG TPA: YifB family Mg chelatase-like AAA ATPase [Streptosporangiaceae bacterium]|nr:YifB family Mg chelatase-like AAA ATPase [Streptosporangiaceae bacterium]
MPLARTHSVALIGVTGQVVEIEADIANGLVGMILVGLPDTALREARDRIRAAIVNSGEEWPQRKITVGLSPASLPKRGSWFDLAIAVGVLAAAGKVPRAAVDGVIFFGELGLDGRLRPVRGVLPAVAAAANAGFGKIMVAEQNAAEAVLVPGVHVIAASSLTGAADWLRGLPGRDGGPAAAEFEGGQELPSGRVAGARGALGSAVSGGRAGQVAASGAAMAPDLAELLGQSMARRAAEVCAAGGHHLSLLGPPGAGKTMLAERIPTILPRLDTAAALEVTGIHSVAGTLPPQVPLLTDPPFLAPHHTATKAAIVGGGSGIIVPGSASLAHRGVLFLDEAPEFAKDVLDALRQPLEAGEVVVARLGVITRFPARFTLVLAANPCPCARVAGPAEGCSCSPAMRRRYLGRISGPLLDRVDVKIELEPVGRRELLNDRTFAESSRTVALRVIQARDRAAHRLRGTPWRLNAEVPGSELRRTWPPAPGSLAAVERSLDRGQISARGVVKVIRVAWTIADLAGRPRPTKDDCNTALGLWLGVRR